MDKRENHASQDYADNFDLSAAKFIPQQNSLDDVVTVDTLHVLMAN